MISIDNALQGLVKDIQKSVRVKDKNRLIAITGETGSGKSNIGISLASMIDAKFSVDHIVFDSEDFLNLLKSGKLRKGSVVVWDEAGVGMGAREFMTVINRVLSTVTQTFRHLNLVVIFTLPYLSFLDKSTRILIHINIETKVIYYKEEVAVCKWFNLQYNPRADNGRGKMYYHYPRIVRDRGVIVLEEIEIPHAPKDIWKEYLKKAREFKELVRTQALKTIRDIKGKSLAEEKKEELDMIDEYSKEVIAKYPKFLGTRGGGLNAYKIRVTYGVNNKQAELIRAKATIVLEEKGKINNKKVLIRKGV